MLIKDVVTQSEHQWASGWILWLSIPLQSREFCKIHLNLPLLFLVGTCTQHPKGCFIGMTQWGFPEGSQYTLLNAPIGLGFRGNWWLCGVLWGLGQFTEYLMEVMEVAVHLLLGGHKGFIYSTHFHVVHFFTHSHVLWVDLIYLPAYFLLLLHFLLLFCLNH